MRTPAIALALAALAAPTAMVATPAVAQAATDADAKAAAAFIDELADDAFTVIRNGDPDDKATQDELRAMLAENFDVRYIGQYLIRRHRKDITSDQYRAYMRIFPKWVVATYTNNLFAFNDSRLEITRAIPRGTRGDVEVFTRVIPKSGSPIGSIWQVRKQDDGKFLIRNLKVSGVNMALTQEQDFNAYIGRKGFDALVQLMQRRAA